MTTKSRTDEEPVPTTGGAWHLVELFLPLYDGHAKPTPKAQFDQIRDELTKKFGGVTAFLRSPAAGQWADGQGQVERDDVVLFEVMTPVLDRHWWGRYRKALEQRLEQHEILVRATMIVRL